MNKRKKAFETAYKPPSQRPLWPLFMLTLTFSFLHLVNFLAPHPPHSLFRYFRCVCGGLKTAFAAVSKEASASQQTAPVLSLMCPQVLDPTPAGQVHLLLALILQGLSHRPAVRILWPRARGPPWRTRQL